jgi:hypothetical protein
VNYASAHYQCSLSKYGFQASGVRTKVSADRAATGHLVTSVNVVEFAVGLEVATVQVALGESGRVSFVVGGLSISPMASTPM